MPNRTFSQLAPPVIESDAVALMYCRLFILSLLSKSCDFDRSSTVLSQRRSFGRPCIAAVKIRPQFNQRNNTAQ
jgi:hypothetical protein